MPPNNSSNNTSNSNTSNTTAITSNTSSTSKSKVLDTSAAFWELNLNNNDDSTNKNESSSTSNNRLTQWLQQHIAEAAVAQQITDPTVQEQLYQHVSTAVRALHVEIATTTHHSTSTAEEDTNEEDQDDNHHGERPRKKRKTAAQQRRFLRDPFRIWFQATTTDPTTITTPGTTKTDSDNVLWDEEQDDIPETDGGKLAVLSIGGWLNGLAGGLPITTTTHIPNPKALFPQAVKSGVAQRLTQLFSNSQPQQQPITVLTLHGMAVALHRAVAQTVQTDILRTTPRRIQQLLASELTVAEFQSVRKRVYDTVILGKGMHVDDNNANNNDEDDTSAPTTAQTALHDMDKFKRCPTCGNNDQSDFVLDRRNGDVICEHCGTVVSESIMHEGSQYRKFEGEVDRNHHGDAANPLLSNAHNLSTSLTGVVTLAGSAGGAGWGAQSTATSNKRNLETILKNVHAYTELNVSQFGKTDRRTRIGYKDRQKKDAFLQMMHAGDALNLHEAVVQRAKEIFAGFRDDRELVQQFKGVLAACLCEAFEQLSAEGRHLTRQQQQQADQQQQRTSNTADDAAQQQQQQQALSARAARRNELHHATLAGKGGLLLNNNNNNSAVAVVETASSAASNASDNGKTVVTDDQGHEKPAASWDLEDCRSWLLEASRNIAQAWDAERQNNTALAKQIPALPFGELEGRLVEHSITLCEHLETEIQSRGSAATTTNGTTANRRKVISTPRVNDMSKLGIKWQHAHERGSGGRGGVGGSGRAGGGRGRSGGGGVQRTAGQILLLKTAKKLGDVLQDPLAGEAFHRELRAVIGRQEAWKQKEMREEATRQRLNQMQRKPWLQARMQQ